MKITPVLVVENIEKSLPFWVERMGFEKTVEVPETVEVSEEARLGFVILVREGAELMIQTAASAKGLPGNATLFIEVENFADILRRLEGCPIAIPERLTFYGMREIGVRDPDSNIAIFAVSVEQALPPLPLS